MSHCDRSPTGGLSTRAQSMPVSSTLAGKPPEAPLHTNDASRINWSSDRPAVILPPFRTPFAVQVNAMYRDVDRKGILIGLLNWVYKEFGEDLPSLVRMPAHLALAIAHKASPEDRNRGEVTSRVSLRRSCDPTRKPRLPCRRSGAHRRGVEPSGWFTRPSRSGPRSTEPVLATARGRTRGYLAENWAAA